MHVPIKVAIIDDEPLSLELTQHLLDQLPYTFAEIIPCLGSQKGLECIKQQHPQLVLLDIEMPIMNGFSLLEKVKALNFGVIFVTAYDKYSIQAFKTSATDYLLKPLKKNKLEEAIKRFIETKMVMSNDHFNFLLQQIKELQNKTIHKIALPTLDGIKFFKVVEIEAFEAHESICYLYGANKERTVINLRFQQIVDKLEALDFFQTHRSFLLNLAKIGQVKRNEGIQAFTESGLAIPVSRRRKQEFMELIDNMTLG